MRFIHYGCWNNINCEYGTNYRDMVIDYIKHYEQSDYKFIIISGDNWYANEKDNASYYFTNVLRSGLVKLYNLGKPVHIILGNHDEDVGGDIDIKKQNCMMFTEEHTINRIDAISKLPAMNILGHLPRQLLSTLRPSFEYLFHSYRENTNNKKSRLLLYKAKYAPESWYDTKENILFIFLNTNIFDKADRGLITKYISEIPIIIMKYKLLKNIIIVGHIPISSAIAKNKNEYQNNISLDANIMETVINVFSSIEPKPLYLCADTHNFQILSIEGIIEIVAGTGGADADAPPKLKQGNKVEYDYNYNGNKKYHITGFHHNSYGYSIIDIDNDGNIKVIYKHLYDINGSPVNMAYEYIIVNNEIQQTHHRLLSDSKQTLEQIKSINNMNARIICQNLHDDNIIKSKDRKTDCYIKIKKSK